MAKTKGANFIGKIAFLVGFILALLLGAFQITLAPMGFYFLVVIGLVVGLLNITEREVSSFLMSGLVLVLVSYFGVAIMPKAPIIESILTSLAILFVPATLIVAVKNVFSLARS